MPDWAPSAPDTPSGYTPYAPAPITVSTARDIIIDALKEIGAIGLGEADGVDNELMQDGLRMFQRMVRASNTNRSNIFTINIAQYVLTANKQSYSLGVDPDGIQTPDLIGPRPQKIERGHLLLQNNPPLRRPLKIWTDEDWFKIRYQQIYTYPEGVYSDGSYPFTNLLFYPIPNAAYTIELYSWLANVPPADLSTEILFPDGYEDYWHYQLALRLCPQLGAQPSQLTVQGFQRAEIAIQTMNQPQVKTQCDPAVLAPGGAGFNWMSREQN